MILILERNKTFTLKNVRAQNNSFVFQNLLSLYLTWKELKFPLRELEYAIQVLEEKDHNAAYFGDIYQDFQFTQDLVKEKEVS